MSDVENPKKTPLYNEHIRLGARMVPFVGWSMPVQYKGLRIEHEAVRNNVGIFDVSHMGEFRVSGPNALETLEWLTTNHVAKLENGQAQYSLLTNPEGGIVDDLIIYCLEKNDHYLLCVNAANIEKDWNWVVSNNKFNAELSNDSELWAQIAIQGPKALKLMDEVFEQNVSDTSLFSFKHISWKNDQGILARTGYTGEHGFEFFIQKDGAASFWNHLLQVGKKYHLQPAGLGARDTLRTEMKYSLYGNEITDTTTPYEAGLGWVVKPQLKEFIGKTALLNAKESKSQRKLVGFKILDKGIARQGSKIINSDGQEIGHVTSGTMSPSLGEAIGIAYLPTDISAQGTEFYIDIRGRKAKSLVVKTPFVKPKSE